MQEAPENFAGGRSPKTAERESERRRFQELAEKHNLLNREMRKLMEEQGSLISGIGYDEADHVRIDEIDDKLSEIITKEQEIIDAVAELWRPAGMPNSGIE
jgi:hypothetical protein